MEIILRPGWDPYQGRYFAPLIALSAPLMARWFKEKGGARYEEWVLGAFAVVIIAVTMLYNPAKPTLGKFADEFHVWNNDRVFVQTIQRKKNRDMYYMVEKIVPPESTLGYFAPFFIMDYPLFGETLSRRLVPVVSRSQLSDGQWLREQEIDYLLLPKRNDVPTPPSGYQVVKNVGAWTLYEYTSTP